MSELLTGRGPQPPAVYWVRRGLVALIAVAVVVLLVWAFAPKGEQPGAGIPVPVDTPSVASSDPSPTPAPSDGASGGSAPDSSAAAVPEACEPIGVQLSLKGFKSVQAGSRQAFSVTAENNTAMPCVMAITPATFVLRVTSGSDLVFSTAHCDTWLPTVEKRTLKAGATVEFQVDWKAFRSASGCQRAKAVPGAGTYIATAAYRESAKARFVFLLTKK